MGEVTSLYENENYSTKHWNSEIYMRQLNKIAIILPKETPFRYEQDKINTYPLSTVPLGIPKLSKYLDSTNEVFNKKGDKK